MFHARKRIESHADTRSGLGLLWILTAALMIGWPTPLSAQEREGLRNPLADGNNKFDIPICRDDELLAFGVRFATEQVHLGLARNPSPDGAVLADTFGEGIPVTGATGRILGLATEQVAYVKRSTTTGNHTLEIIHLYDPLQPDSAAYAPRIVATWPFDVEPARSNSQISLAVGDVDDREDENGAPVDAITLEGERHWEVALAYEILDAGERKIRLVVLSFEGIDSADAATPTAPISVTSAVLPRSPLFQSSDAQPNPVVVQTGFFNEGTVTDQDIRPGIVVAFPEPGQLRISYLKYNTVANQAGEVISRSIAPRLSGNAFVPSPGVEAGGLAEVGGWDLVAGDFLNPADPCPGDDDVLRYGQRVMVVYKIKAGSTAGELQFLMIGADPTLGAPADSWPLNTLASHHQIGGGALVLNNSTLRVSAARLEGEGSTNEDRDGVFVMADTDRGPILSAFSARVFSAGNCLNSSITISRTVQAPNASQTWPPSLIDRPMNVTETSGANFEVGEYLVNRVSQEEYLGIYISWPEDPDPDAAKLTYLPIVRDAPPPSFQLEPGAAVRVPTFEPPGGGQPVSYDSIPLMLAPDSDGDAGYFEFDGICLGEPTRITLRNYQSLELLLQEPPKHIDYLPELGGLINISMSDEFFTEFSQEQTVSKLVESRSRLDLVVGESFELSNTVGFGVGAKGAFGGASISGTVTGKLEEINASAQSSSTSTTQTITSSEISQAQRDDQLLIREQIIDIWRYPVIGLAAEQGEQPLDKPVVDVVVPGPFINNFGPGRLNDAYQPIHQNGNILTYPAAESDSSQNGFNPPDIGPYYAYPPPPINPGDPLPYQDTNGLTIDDCGSPLAPSNCEAATQYVEPLWADSSFAVGGLSVSRRLTLTNEQVESNEIESRKQIKESLDINVTAQVEVSKGLFSASNDTSFTYTRDNETSISNARLSQDTVDRTSARAVRVPHPNPAERS